MPRTVEVSAQARVAAPAPVVWAAAVDWRRQREWMWATEVRGGQGHGAKLVARTGVGPFSFVDRMRVETWEPPRLCEVRHTGRVVRGTASFEVIPVGQVSVFRWSERLELPFGALGRIGWPLVAPLARLALRGSVRRFARMVAQPPPS